MTETPDLKIEHVDPATRQRAPLWMRTMLRLWPGGRGKRDDAPLSDETLRGYLKDAQRDASKDGPA